MKRKFNHIQSMNKFNINKIKHIKYCQNYCTYCSPERYTILIHNEHLNQIHYTMCPYDELLIMAKSICTNLMQDNNNNQNDNNNNNDQTKLQLLIYGQGKITEKVCIVWFLGSKTPNINCDAYYTQKFNITQNSNKKHTGNMEKIFIENETDNEVMRYMSKFDWIKNCAQTRSENHKPNRLKDLQLSVNLRPPEPVGCQLLQMNSAPGEFNIIHDSIKRILDIKIRHY
ncbi:unnamed protein product [Schistosoma margrebowiei]|uniref:Uncharacterized protein n=1 Tax=Schistosoma margrebowiei TaxID=48269 RepID=A0A183MFA9_9TREM|nr:unnamed protein product [Schistosoma margrebowiei]